MTTFKQFLVIALVFGAVWVAAAPASNTSSSDTAPLATRAPRAKDDVVWSDRRA
ncbi:hypothetical protein H4R33_001708 [Dimargaris cristalligena]|nr:hypothetical protein H4R33_001708 [Dimargaris cristalligena]